MKRIKELIFIIFIVVGLFFISNPVVACNDIEESSNITMVGAQIRTSGIQGIRFIGRVNLDEFLEEQGIQINDITKFGIVVSYGEASCENLYLGSTVNNKTVLSGESSSLFNPNTGDFTVVLYNISQSRYLQKFSARGYIKYNDGEEKVVYSSDIIVRSIYEVAKKALEESNIEYCTNVVNYVENTLCAGVKTINEVKNLYETNSNSSVIIKGVVTAVSTGTYLNVTLEDETGAIMLFNKSNSTYSDILVKGNEVILSGTVTKYNGLYEITNISNCVLVNGGNDTTKLVIEASLPFDSGDLKYQNKVVSGFLTYISTTNNYINFKTNNETSVLMYVDYKWSEFNATNASSSLEIDKYYYVNALVGNYNGIQLIPYDAENAILSIQSISVENLEEEYILGSFDYKDLKLKVLLSDGSFHYFNVTQEMLLQEELDKLTFAGEKEITISHLGINTRIRFNIVEKEVFSIRLLNGDFNGFVGDKLNVQGMNLEITYADSDVVTIPLTAEMVNGYDTSTSGTKNLIIRYNNKELIVKYDVLKPIIIYDIYGGGGNANASYLNDYVVLYNNTNFDIDLSEYKLQYVNSSGSTFTVYPSLNGIIYSNSYFVVVGSKGNSNLEAATVPFTNCNVELNMAQGAGYVALTKGEVPTTINDSSLIDIVKYSGLSSTTSYRRTSFVNDSYEVTNTSFGYLEELLSIVDIDVTGVKSKYQIGETLDLSNAKFKVIYQNGSSELIAIKESDISGFASTKVGAFKMTFTYKNFIVDVVYTVSANEELLDVKIYFIDLGKNISDCGEATYIKVGNDIDILIDAGEHSEVSANEVIDVINKAGSDGVLDYVIASHAHSDHIGGMRYVLPKYDIKNVIEFHHKYGYDENDSNVVGYYLKARSKADNIVTAYDLITNQGNGSSYKWIIAEGVSFTFYNSGFLNTQASDKNQQSVICVFEAHGIRVLFNGDAEEQCEVTYAPLVGDVDIFKMPHHGTYNGTSTTLLQNIKPEVGIVCNGNYLGNRYGHPTYDAMSRIYNYDEEINVYAITGATINNFTNTSTNGPGSSKYTLYGYKTTKRYNFYFNCTTFEEALGQRNGNICISITSENYQITSELGINGNPYEMRETNYWKEMIKYINS